MHAEDRKSIDRRLARIEGQVRGIRKLIEQDSYCLDVLQQITAVSSAMNQVAAQVASQHIKHCILGHGTQEAHDSTILMTKEDVIEELGEVLSRLVR